MFANVLRVNKYLQSLDYQHGRPQHYNRKQIKGLGATRPGSYRLILAHENPGEGEKNVLFEPFIYKTDHFTKTGSGQT